MGQTLSNIIKCICGDPLEVEERRAHRLLSASASAPESIAASGFPNQLQPEESEHQNLVMNAKKLIGSGGEIHISHITSKFHRQWNLEELASEAGLGLLGTARFKKSDYPGYNSKYCFGSDRNFDCNPSQTYKFGLPVNGSHTGCLITPNSHPYSEWGTFDGSITTSIQLQNSLTPLKDEDLNLSSSIGSGMPWDVNAFQNLIPDDSQVLSGHLQETESLESHQRSKKSEKTLLQRNGEEEVESKNSEKTQQKREGQEVVESLVWKPIAVKEKRRKHYTSDQKILLVGEGDFSFSTCLALAFGSAANMVATSRDSVEFLTQNYGSALANIGKLKMLGCKVHHGVDATKMGNKKSKFKGKVFDRIIFNFPHTGFSNRNEPWEVQISEHQKLVRGFLMNAKKLIANGGEIHISHKTNKFHREWNLEGLALDAGLTQLGTARFKRSDYPGYNSKYGFGGDGNFNCNPSRTYKFGLTVTHQI